MAAQIKIAASTDTTISIFTTDEAGQRRLASTISIQAGNETSFDVADGAEVSMDVHSSIATPVTATSTPVSSSSKTGIRSTATITGS